MSVLCADPGPLDELCTRVLHDAQQRDLKAGQCVQDDRENFGRPAAVMG